MVSNLIMKILFKDNVKVVCRDDHQNTDGWNVIEIPDGYNIYKKNPDDGNGIELVKDIEEINAELNLSNTL